MCYDPWEEGIHKFSQLYLNALTESRSTQRTETHRRMWTFRAEAFEVIYPDKVAELTDDDLDTWLDDIEESFEGEALELLLVPAEKELKKRIAERVTESA